MDIIYLHSTTMQGTDTRGGDLDHAETFVNCLKQAKDQHTELNTRIRFYDESNGVEFQATTIYIEDGVLCVDLKKTGEITGA
jgi:hypothetical protein